MTDYVRKLSQFLSLTLPVLRLRRGLETEAAVEFRAEAVNRKRIDEQMKALGVDVVQ